MQCAMGAAARAARGRPQPVEGRATAARRRAVGAGQLERRGQEPRGAAQGLPRRGGDGQEVAALAGPRLPATRAQQDHWFRQRAARSRHRHSGGGTRGRLCHGGAAPAAAHAAPLRAVRRGRRPAPRARRARQRTGAARAAAHGRGGGGAGHAARQPGHRAHVARLAQRRARGLMDRRDAALHRLRAPHLGLALLPAPVLVAHGAALHGARERAVGRAARRTQRHPERPPLRDRIWSCIWIWGVISRDDARPRAARAAARRAARRRAARARAPEAVTPGRWQRRRAAAVTRGRARRAEPRAACRARRARLQAPPHGAAQPGARRRMPRPCRDRAMRVRRACVPRLQRPKARRAPRMHITHYAYT